MRGLRIRKADRLKTGAPRYAKQTQRRRPGRRVLIARFGVPGHQSHMQRHALAAVFILFNVFIGFAQEARIAGFLHTRGEDVVDGRGRKVMLRGVGLGNWLLPEGYMWRFGNRGDRPRKIEKLVSDLLGPEQARKFWSEFRRGYITEADIRRIAELGFNSVRVPLNARLFLSEGEKPVFLDEGFELLDNLVRWCKASGVYVIIDMHAAPGGQTGQNIDDSANDQPELFTNRANQAHLVELWVKIAQKYKDEPAVAAYDLLNEPLPARTGAAAKYKQELEPLYRRVTAAIREVDKKHMLTLEGADWANDWSVFTTRFDDNLLYQFHYYCWDRPANLKGVQQYLQHRKRLGAPIWVGETGEKDATIYWGTTDYFEANNIGWAFWPWKKMDTQNTPYSINTPAGWDAVAAYSRNPEKKPSSEEAQRSFDELLKNIRLANCMFFPGVVDALLRQAPVKVEAENYGHQGPNHSYFVKDSGNKSKYYRKSEPVPVELFEGGDGQWRSAQGITLASEEWTTYRVNSPETRRYEVVVRAKAATLPAAFEVLLNNQGQETSLTSTNWAELKMAPAELMAGSNELKLRVKTGKICFDWTELK